MAREIDPSKLVKTGQFSVTLQYHWQVEAARKYYFSSVKLIAWPYGNKCNHYIITVDTYGDFCLIKD